MNPERAGSENKAPRVVQFEVETLLKNETKNALETNGNGDLERGRQRDETRRKREKVGLPNQRLSPQRGWLLMGCSKTVRNNLKPPRPCGQQRRSEIGIGRGEKVIHNR